MSTRARKFTVGHMYSIDYADHFSVDKSYREDENGTPMVLRQRGVLLMETDKCLIIEHGVHQSDSHARNKRSDRNGIVKSCIIRVQDFGPEKMDK